MSPTSSMRKVVVVFALTLACSVGLVTLVRGAESTGGPASGSPGTSPGDGGAGPSGAGMTSDAYMIRVDDVLTIEGTPLSGRMELRARSYRVSEDGTVMMPYLQRVEVAGLTVRQAEEMLMKKYDPDYFKHLVINIEVRLKSYTIMGEVRNPGVKDLLTGTTVVMAVATAGGFTDFADMTEVTVIRLDSEGKAVRRVIDCKAILKRTAPDDFLIRPNDTLWVPRKGII